MLLRSGLRVMPVRLKRASSGFVDARSSRGMTGLEDFTIAHHLNRDVRIFWEVLDPYRFPFPGRYFKVGGGQSFRGCRGGAEEGKEGCEQSCRKSWSHKKLISHRFIPVKNIEGFARVLLSRT
jgi:hypothetical protein